MEKIVDRAHVGTCAFCGESVYTRVAEGHQPVSPLSEDVFSKTYYTCDGCGRLMCRNCLAKRDGFFSRKYFCRECVTSRSP